MRVYTPNIVRAAAVATWKRRLEIRSRAGEDMSSPQGRFALQAQRQQEEPEAEVRLLQGDHCVRQMTHMTPCLAGPAEVV
ncbi:protein of unknown function [Cupriavidus neocaledonicus]|uniref:Uncharacterized protein n=1 Tax=Cupriavidus neocaledonicus TaxID=1040979 RepID=A0A375H4D2_9BURK|nr:protein of unknown function [Cupriavidus neocaledonicus]